MRKNLIVLTSALFVTVAPLLPQTADRSSLWLDTVKRGEMIRQIRGLGEIASPQTAVLQVAETQVR